MLCLFDARNIIIHYILVWDCEIPPRGLDLILIQIGLTLIEYWLGDRKLINAYLTAYDKFT